MEDVSIDIPGGRMNVWHRPAEGRAPTAVLIHGLSGTSRWWTSVIDHLPDRLGLIALDVRGRGGSHDSPPPYDLVTMADDIAVALDHFSVDRAIVAGYSMGGWIAAIFATRHPDMAQRVVLIDGGLALPLPPDAEADDVIRSVVGPSLARLEVEFETRDAFLDHWRAHPALERHWDPSMAAALDYELHPRGDNFAVLINPQAIEVSARQITVDPTTRNAGIEVTVPAHLIVVERGTADQPGGMIPLQTAETAATELTNLTIEYLPGVNHYTLILGVGAVPVASAIATA
jgi:pimeloyl-ACP methyl ester carboxylesterase